MKTEKIEIDNLKCNGCANTIRRELAWIGEVIDVEVDIPGSVVIVNYTGKNNMRADFVKLLRKLGYPEKGTGNFGRKVKSYASCMIGRIGS
jgi:copper chaperone